MESTDRESTDRDREISSGVQICKPERYIGMPKPLKQETIKGQL